MFRKLLSVGGFTLLSRITGFVRDILMAWILGKGILSDAFIVAFLFPNYFRAIFGEGTINPAFLPRYAALHAKGEHKAAAQFADRVFSWQVMAQLVILIGALIFMPWIVRVLAPGFSDNPGQLALTVHLSRITFPYLILTLVAVQLSAMLNALEKFWAAAAWSNFLNLAMIATLLMTPLFPNAAEAAQFADRVFSWQVMAQLLILIFALIAMPWIVRILAPGFSDNPGQLAMTVHLSRITFPYLILTLVAVQLSAMLNAIEKFWAAAAWSNFLNLAMIATLLMTPMFPNAAEAAAWGVLAGGVAQLIFILWAARREGLFLHVGWPRWTPEIKEFFVAFGAVTFGAASVVIAPFIDTVIASLLPTGSRTALYYADRINQLPLGVLGIALGTVLLPEMSSRLAVNDREGSNAAQNRAAALSLFLTLPFAVVFVAIPDTIMHAIFAHGAFDRSAAELSALALSTYGVGLPAFALVRIVASTFYARHDTLTPMRATLAAIGVNIALKLVFVWGFHFGIAGIALGTSLGAWVNVGILFWMGRKRGLIEIESQFLRSLGPILFAAAITGAGAIAGVVLGGMMGAGRWQDETMLGLAILFGGVGYLAVTFLFRDQLPLGRFAKAA